MTTVTILLALLLAGLCVEAIVVRRWTSSFRVRIHVGGTRGKSTVVRYITAALRHSGYRVFGKVTGEIPTVLLPDGTSQRLTRRGPARVQEQVRMLALARKHSCDAVVLECMSLNPLLQTLEARVLQPTISVLTNILDDHREEFGALPRGQAEAMCAFFPSRAALVSNEQVYGDVVDSCATRVSTRVIRAINDGQELPVDVPPGVHAENIALAVAVCEELGIKQDAALQAILEEARVALPPLRTFATPRGCLRFVDGFTVNDVSSATRFLERWRAHIVSVQSITVILNTRADRPIRSLQFAAWCGTLRDLEHVVVTGTHRARTRRALRECGVDPARITVWSSAESRHPVDALQNLHLPDESLVVGMGNIAGDGFAILEGMQQWS